MKDEESTIGAANGRMVACLTITSGNCTHRNCICNGTNWYILSSNACCPQTKWPNKIIDKKSVDEFIFSLANFAYE